MQEESARKAVLEKSSIKKDVVQKDLVVWETMTDGNSFKLTSSFSYTRNTTWY